MPSDSRNDTASSMGSGLRPNGLGLGLAAAILALGTACQGTGSGPGTGASTPIPDAGSAQAIAFRNQCSRCHALPHPKRHSFSEWQHYLGLMDRRMEERGMPPLAGEERQKVLDYLREHSRGQGT